jgi:hypothetical protein
MEEQDPRTKLIQSLTEFTKGPEPRSVHEAQGHFREQIKWTRDRLRRSDMTDQLLQLANAGAREDDPKSVIKAWRTARFILALIARENNDPRVPTTMREVVLKAEAVWLKKPISLHLRRFVGADFVEESVPLWNSASICAADALGLLLTDYRGLFSKVHACPLVLKDEEAWWLWSHERIESQHALHFFVDTRFKKGQRMVYCEPAHQARHYRRLKRQAEKAAILAATQRPQPTRKHK